MANEISDIYPRTSSVNTYESSKITLFIHIVLAYMPCWLWLIWTIYGWWFPEDFGTLFCTGNSLAPIPLSFHKLIMENFHLLALHLFQINPLHIRNPCGAETRIFITMATDVLALCITRPPPSIAVVSTHLPLVLHICVGELGQRWFR